MADEGAMALYGRGAELGNLKWYADDLVGTEITDIAPARIRIHEATRRDTFFRLLREQAASFKLKQLHVYSHAIGAGLFLGYKDEELKKARGAIFSLRRGQLANYTSVLQTEQGTVFTDDLIREPYKSYRAALRKLFVADAYIKLWGCNAGVDGWVYSDESEHDPNTQVYALDAPGKYYYWRSLNERNTPKPSIAQAFADYFGVKVFAATSGSHGQARLGGKWVNPTPEGKITVKGRLRYIQEQDTIRLEPDKGKYREYLPR